MRYGLRLGPLVFNQSIWITNLIPTNATMQMNNWPNIRNILIFRYGPKYEWRIPSRFTTTQKRQIFVKKLAMDGFLLISHFCSFLFSFCPTQGHPIEAFGTHSSTYLLYGLKKGSNKVPVQHAYLSFYMPLFLELGLPFVCHQPSTSTSYRAYH